MAADKSYVIRCQPETGHHTLVISSERPFAAIHDNMTDSSVAFISSYATYIHTAALESAEDKRSVLIISDRADIRRVSPKSLYVYCDIYRIAARKPLSGLLIKSLYSCLLRKLFSSALCLSILHLPVKSSAVHIMSCHFLYMSIYAVRHSMHDQMTDRVTVSVVYSLKLIVSGIDNCEVF